MAKYVIRRIIFAQNCKISLRNINNSPKTIGNKAQAIKLMMSALNMTFGYVRPTRIFHNITPVKKVTVTLLSVILKLKKAYEGPPILHPSVQTSSSEPIAMVGNDISL